MIEKLKSLIEKNKYIANIIRYVYRTTILKYQHHKQNKLFLQNASSVMFQIDNVFEELKIDYWLEYGTLLGAIREKGFISHDLDIDLGLYLNDYSEHIQVVFNKYGFKKRNKISIDNGQYGLEESYIYKDIVIDLFYFTRKDSQYYSHGFKNEDGKSWSRTIQDNGGLIVREIYFPHGKIKKINFLGKEFPVPVNSEEHLKAFYGDNYLIPNSSWDPYTMAKNIKTLNNKIGVVKYYD